jgi:hypothetical protein
MDFRRRISDRIADYDSALMTTCGSADTAANCSTATGAITLESLEASIAEARLATIGVVPEKITFRCREDMERHMRALGQYCQLRGEPNPLLASSLGAMPPFNGIPIEYDASLPPMKYKIKKRLA